MVGELSSDLTVATRCDEGHDCHVVLQNHPFEILFESGALALIDGYPREAVTSFAAALERFFEFYVLTILRQRDFASEAVESTWKLVAVQSERQFGSFVIAHLFESGQPFVLKRQLTEFRNKVVHKGYMATTQEAVEYGAAILALMDDIIIRIRPTHLRAMMVIRTHDAAERQKRLGLHRRLLGSAE